ncbi:MAG TPA: alpha/beta hydrolase [Solirubrobacterales bacterium]|nr:alpha/beta hydrolase [Solirubrobacterales bacterium]
MMETVTSADGTRIAFDRYGSGPTVILVAGALGFRRFKRMEELAQLLADSCTVINYDRRGRGDSTEVKPYALEREFEDLAALTEACGGSASLWGWSSGGALALRAAASGVPVEKLSVFEVPFMVQPGLDRPTPDYGARLAELVAADDRDGAVRHFMRNAIGIPAPVVAMMRFLPLWKGARAAAHTLPYDWAALGEHTMYGKPLSPEEWAPVTAPTLVVHGDKSPEPLQAGSRALAEVLPNATLQVLEGTRHNLSMKKIAPVLARFFAGR